MIAIALPPAHQDCQVRLKTLSTRNRVLRGGKMLFEIEKPRLSYIWTSSQGRRQEFDFWEAKNLNILRGRGVLKQVKDFCS